jgi:hypothetical protein
MMIALRIALGRTLSVASAITEVRRMHPSAPAPPSTQLSAAMSLEKPEEAR